MKKSDIDKVLKQLSIKEGVTVEEIRTEISKAIDEGFSNKDPMVQANWKKMFKNGKKPSLEEFIWCLTKDLKENMSEWN